LLNLDPQLRPFKSAAINLKKDDLLDYVVSKMVPVT
jgi:hypothetical protein